MGAKRSSAIFAAGETKRDEASGNASLLDVWLLVEMGGCEKINGFVLHRVPAPQKHL